MKHTTIWEDFAALAPIFALVLIVSLLVGAVVYLG